MIVACWSGPRNISTALMRAWSSRKDTFVTDEPFYAHFLEFSQKKHPMREKMLYRKPINPSLDGNTVELGVEQMQFSENVVRYQTTLQFLNNRISGLMSAIRGE